MGHTSDDASVCNRLMKSVIKFFTLIKIFEHVSILVASVIKLGVSLVRRVAQHMDVACIPSLTALVTVNVQQVSSAA